MAFTGRPNVTDAERNRMAKTSGPKYLLLKTLETLKAMPEFNLESIPEIKKGRQSMVKTTLTVKPWDARLKSGIPMSDPIKEASFQKWLKNRNGS